MESASHLPTGSRLQADSESRPTPVWFCAARIGGKGYNPRVGGQVRFREAKEKELMDFRERVILVTGAASGIGQALCRQLGSAGACLGLVDRDEAGLERFRAELKVAGVRHGPGCSRRPQARRSTFGRGPADGATGPD